jgi:hypothetical protein
MPVLGMCSVVLCLHQGADDEGGIASQGSNPSVPADGLLVPPLLLESTCDRAVAGFGASRISLAYYLSYNHRCTLSGNS